MMKSIDTKDFRYHRYPIRRVFYSMNHHIEKCLFYSFINIITTGAFLALAYCLLKRVTNHFFLIVVISFFAVALAIETIVSIVSQFIIFSKSIKNFKISATYSIVNIILTIFFIVEFIVFVLWLV